MDIKDQITAALKKLGPVSPGRLADELGTEPSRLSYHVKAMIEAGTLKATGITSGRRIALADQNIDDSAGAPPQSRKKAATKKGKKAKREAPAPRASEPAPPPEGDFIAAVTADSRLVLFVPGQKPMVFSDAHTESVAELMLTHFKD